MPTYDDIFSTPTEDSAQKKKTGTTYNDLFPKTSGNLATDIPKMALRGIAQLPETVAQPIQTGAGYVGNLIDQATGNDKAGPGPAESAINYGLGTARDYTTRALEKGVAEALPYSAGTQEAQQRLGRDVDAITQNKDLNLGQKIYESGKAALTNPRGSLTAFGESVPQFFAGAGLLRAAGVGKGLTGAQQASNLYKQNIGLNALLEGSGGSKGAREEVEQTSLDQLRQSPDFLNLEKQYGTEQALKIAGEQAGSSAFLPAAVGGGAATALTGGGGEGKILGKLFGSEAGDVVEPGFKNALKYLGKETLKSAGKEGSEEFLQGATGQLGQNVGTQPYTGTNLTTGVPEQAASSGVAGLFGAGAFGPAGSIGPLSRAARRAPPAPEQTTETSELNKFGLPSQRDVTQDKSKLNVNVINQKLQEAKQRAAATQENKRIDDELVKIKPEEAAQTVLIDGNLVPFGDVAFNHIKSGGTLEEAKELFKREDQNVNDTLGQGATVPSESGTGQEQTVGQDVELPDIQTKGEDQLSNEIISENVPIGEKDAIEEQRAGGLDESGSARQEVRKEGRDTAGSSPGVLPGRQETQEINQEIGKANENADEEENADETKQRQEEVLLGQGAPDNKGASNLADDNVNVYGVKNQPRLAEDGTNLFKKIVKLTNERIVNKDDGRIVSPVVNIIGTGEFEILKNPSNEKIEYRKINNDGTYRLATDSEIDDIHDSFDKDMVEIYTKSNWGGSGRDVGRKRLVTLHSPRGNSFKGLPDRVNQQQDIADENANAEDQGTGRTGGTPDANLNGNIGLNGDNIGQPSVLPDQVPGSEGVAKGENVPDTARKVSDELTEQRAYDTTKPDQKTPAAQPKESNANIDTAGITPTGEQEAVATGAVAESVITQKSGKSFSKEKTAQAALNSGRFVDPVTKQKATPETHTVIQHNGGYALAPIKKSELTSKDLEGEKINKAWTKFSDESGTLNIPRNEMPQVKAEHRGALVNFLNAKGIQHEKQTVPAESLKPTQAEFSPEKVKKAQSYEGGNRSILVSSDNYVVDGHHQWLAKLNNKEDIDVIRLNKPIKSLLDDVKEFPSSEQSKGASPIKPKEPNEQSSKTETAPKKEEAGTKKLPNILRQSQNAYLLSQKKNYQKSNPKALPEARKEKYKEIDDSYQDELDKAYASISFEQYQALPENKGKDKDELKPIHDALRKEYGISKEPVQKGEEIAKRAQEKPSTTINPKPNIVVEGDNGEGQAVSGKEKITTPTIDDVIFNEGKGFNKNKFNAEFNGISSNYHTDKRASFNELQLFLEARKNSINADEELKIARDKVVNKLRNGEQLNENDMASAFPESYYKKGYVAQRFMNQFISDNFNIPRNKVSKSIGNAFGHVVSDSGVKYPIIRWTRLHNFLKSDQAKSGTVEASLKEGDASTLFENKDESKSTVQDKYQRSSKEAASGTQETKEGISNEQPNESITLQDKTIQNASKGELAEKVSGKEEIGKGNTGKVYRIGDEVEKNATNDEAKVYDALKGVEGIAQGYEKGGKIRLPFYKNIISTDEIAPDKRKNMSGIIRKNIARINKAVSALTNTGYSYNEPYFQFGVNEDQTLDIIDFSNASNKDTDKALINNLSTLARTYKAFGLERVGKAISQVNDVLDGQHYHAKNGRHDLLGDEFDGVNYKTLTDNLDGKPATYAYYTTNGRHVGVGNIAQTDNIDGVKVVLSTNPLSQKDIDNWELVPVFSGKEEAVKGEEKKTQKGVTLAEPAIENIEDFGEVIAGAKKHTYTLSQSVKGDIDVAAVPLSKSFPQPDYEKLVAGGLDPKLAALIAQLRGELKTKPKKSNRLKNWVESVNSVRKIVSDILDGTLTAEKFIEASGNKDNYIQYIGDVLKIAESIPASQIKELGKYKLTKTRYSLYNGEKNVEKWEAIDSSISSGLGGMGNRAAFDTKEQAIAFIKSKVSEDISGPVTKFDIWTERGHDGVFVGKKVAARKYIELKQFNNITEAREYVKDNNEELTELLKKKKQSRDVRRAENNERIGHDYRNGKNVTPKQFEDTFGFRGVQFGNYVENDRRQQDLNNAYDGLMDLADVLGIPTRAIALNGELGLAFGARGTGGLDPASAHYESDNTVINLTKARGAGSLAHEWWHALDNYFGKIEKRGDFLTETGSRPKRIREGNNYRDATAEDYAVRETVFNAWQGIREAIKNETAMVNRAVRRDSTKSKDYWSTVREITARTFERYVIDKLKTKGYENDYLANIISEEVHNASNKLFGTDESYVYPLESEMEAVNKAYDKLFSTVETKETDQGTALFSKGTATGNFTKKTLTDHLVKTFRGLKKLIDNGTVVIHNSFADVPEDVLRNGDVLIDGEWAKYSPKQKGKVEGFYKNGKIHLMADALNADNTSSTLHHEFLHKAIDENPKLKERLLGIESEFKNIMKLVEQGKYRGRYKDIYDAAMKRLNKANPSEADRQEEFLAYIVSEYNRSPTSLPAKLAKLAKDLIAAIKSVIYRMTGQITKISPADLTQFAKSAMRDVSTDFETGNVLAMASKQGYKGNDTGEAAEWLRAKAKGLDMSQSARASRALFMGFKSKVWYHVTPRSFNEFDTSMSDLGAHFGTLRQTQKRQDVMEFSDPKTLKVKLNIWNPLRLKDTGTFHSDGIADQLEKKGLLKKGEGRKIIDEINQNWRMRKIYDPYLVKVIKEAGYDGVVYKNMHEGGGDSIIVFDANKIRSVDAAFDPDYADSPNLLASAQAPRFYSALREAFNKAPDKLFNGPASQVKLWLASNKAKLGVKEDEIYFSGLNDYLDIAGKNKVSKADVLSYLNENQVVTEDKVLGDIDDSRIQEFLDDEAGEGFTWEEAREYLKNDEGSMAAKYADSNYVIPGGKNYKEIVVTIPNIEKYDEADAAHFGDVGEGRQIAHARIDDRTDSNGNEGILVNEFQSRRSQSGRKEGFGRGTPGKKFHIKHDLFWDIYNEYGDKITSYDNEQLAIKTANDFNKNGVPAFLEGNNRGKGVPPAPFISTQNNKATDAYLSLLMKKMVARAIDEGKGFVAWTTGSQQADFYDLSKQVDYIQTTPSNANGERKIKIEFKENIPTEAFEIDETGLIQNGQYEDKNLADVIGKEIANKILKSDDHDIFEGEDLKIKAPWTAAMYGNEQGLDAQGKPSLITKAAQDIAKKFGGKVGTVKLDSGTQPALIITPQMRSKIEAEGMPLFSFAGEKAKTADLYQKSEAERRLANGEDAETIRKETGWHFWKPDGKWRFEIDDSQAKIILEKMKPNLTVKDIIEHDRLFAAYPKIADMKVAFISRTALDGANAAIMDGKLFIASDLGKKETLSTLMHEIQHGIQDIEGFASGSTPEAMRPEDYKTRQKSLINQMELVLESVKKSGNEKKIEKVKSDIKLIREAADYEAYQRVAGEVEARNVQDRLKLTAQQRKEIPPSETQRVKDEDTIVMFNGKKALSAPMPENAQDDIRYSIADDDIWSDVQLPEEKKWYDDVKNKLAKTKDNLFRNNFAFLSVKQMAEVAKDYAPGFKRFADLLQQRESLTSKYMREGDKLISETWRKLNSLDKKRISYLINTSTLPGNDFHLDKAWAGYRKEGDRWVVWTQAKIPASKFNKLEKLAGDNFALQVGKNWAHFEFEGDAKKFLPKLLGVHPDAERKGRYHNLKAKLESLGAPGKKVYNDTNELHNKLFNLRLGALVDNIENAVLDGKKQRALIAAVKAQFEANKVDWYYAPLTRFGRYWLYAADQEGVREFRHFEDENARNIYKDKLKDQGYDIIGFGTSTENLRDLNMEGASDAFIADVQKMIADTLTPEAASALQDQIYQLYLETLPDVSMRKNSIHRQGTAGYEEDAMRSFANSVHHSAKQLSNMKYGHEMQEVLDFMKKAKEAAESTRTKEQLKDEAAAASELELDWKAVENLTDEDQRKLRKQFASLDDTDGKVAMRRLLNRNNDILNAAKLIKEEDRTKVADMINELALSHQNMMKGNTSAMDQFAVALNQMNFVGFLGFGLSSALINAVQTPGVAMPVAAGRHGIAKTLSAFGQSFNEFMQAIKNGELDEDGNISITTILEQKAQSGDTEAIEEMKAMEQFKDFDISRTQTFDLLGVGEQGESYGGYLHDFSKKAGWLFHHGERFNREVTLLASYRLAKKAGDSHAKAIDYARYVNDRAHLDYSSENAARIFRGPLARIALQFKKYQQGMLFLWGKSAYDALKLMKDRDNEQAREAARTLAGLFAMQASLAGTFGLPMMGAVMAMMNVIGGLFDDDDDPWDTEKEIRLGLARMLGSKASEAISKGLVNTLTPIDLSSRLDLADTLFRAPLKELEGRDEATHYLAGLLGPTGGTVQKIYQGIDYLKDGYYMRAAEQFSPKFIGDIAKATRYGTEDAKSIRGNTIKDMNDAEVFFQALGFSSSELHKKYEERSYVKQDEQAILTTRQKLVHKAAEARTKRLPQPSEEIRAWNKKYPKLKITSETISKSIAQTRRLARDRGDLGYNVSKKLRGLVEDNSLS